MKILAIIGFLCSFLLNGQTQIDYTTQVKNRPILSDAGATTFAAACTRGASGGTVSITRAWGNVPTQSCAANLSFNGGSIQPNSTGTVTLSGTISAAPTQIFDYSAGGVVSITGPVSAYPQWWGVRGDGSTDNATPYAQALASALTLKFPPGDYQSSTSLTITRNGTRLIGNSRADTTLTFTGATDGVVISNTALFFGEVTGFKIYATNAGGLKGVSVNTPANSTNVNIHDNFITTSNTGHWAYGVWASGMETGVIARNWIQNHVTIAGIALTAASNGTTIEDNLIGAIESGAKGISVQTSANVVLKNGVIQGTSYSSMLFVDSDATVFIYGTYFENGGAGTAAIGIESSGGLFVSDVWFGGGSYTYGILQGTIGHAYISGLFFGASASVTAVSFNDEAQNVLRDSFIVNYQTGANGVDSRYGQGNTIANNYISATGAGNAILVTDNGEATVISGNRLFSGTGYGIYSVGGGSGYTFSFDHNDFLTNAGFECNGTRTTVGSARANYSHYGGGEMGDISPAIPYSRLATLPNVVVGQTVYCTDCTPQRPTTSGGTGSQVTYANGAWIGAPVNITSGTFTPTLQFGGSSTGITYAARSGRYTIVDGMVSIFISFTLTSKGSATGAATISGLPATIGYQFGGAVTYIGAGTMASLTGTPTVFAPGGQTYVSPAYYNSTGTVFMTDSNFTGTTQMIMSASYQQ